jgi:hypothetical protein
MKEEQHKIKNFNEKVDEKLQFHLFFLKNDEGQSVEVTDVEEIDFAEVEKRLEGGESVFISGKRRQHLDLGRFSMKMCRKRGLFLIYE